jgi:hypothetical protein
LLESNRHFQALVPKESAASHRKVPERVSALTAAILERLNP